MDRLTFSGPFIPLQLGLLWYFLPPWVGIHTIWLVVWPEDALPVLFLLPEVVVVFLLLAAAAAFWASSFFCPAVYKAVVSLVVPFSSTEPTPTSPPVE